MPPISEPWGVYIAGHPKNDTLTNKLFDLTGNERPATITGTYSSGTSNENGAAASIPYIGGTTATKINWPEGSIPIAFTLCSITRVTTSSERAVLIGFKAVNPTADAIWFVHGHWHNPERCSGVAFYGGDGVTNSWKTQPSNVATSAASYQNWLVMCGSNGTDSIIDGKNILANGVGVGTANGGTRGNALIINGSSGATSNFQFQQVIIWESALTNAELEVISDLQLGYLSTGKILYPFAKIIGTNPVITSITNNGTSFSVNFTQDVRGNELSGYKYSLNGGTSFITPTQSITTSQITISTIDGTYPIANNTIYNVSIIVTSTAGDTEKSTSMYAIISTPPVITSITNYGTNFSVVFTQGVTGYPSEFSYWYSLDGGTNFNQASEKISPITITGITYNTIYRVVIKYKTTFSFSMSSNPGSSNVESGISNMVPAIIQVPIVPVYSGTSSPPPVITSITNNGTSFSVNFTQVAISSGNPEINYLYSLDGGFTFMEASQTVSPSPIIITDGIIGSTVYKVVIKHRIATGDSAISNMVPAIIPGYIPSNSNSVSQYYNINNSNILRYYPFDTDLLDYQSGVGESNVTSTVSISNTFTKLSTGSVNFPGTNVQSLKIPNITFDSGGITVAVWMKCNSIPTNWSRIFDFGDNYDTRETGTSFLVGFQHPGQGDLAIVTERSVYYNLYQLTDTNWHHYAFVVKPSPSSVDVYVDGIKTATPQTTYPGTVTRQSCFIGKSNWSSDTNYINCYMNQFVIFNRALNETEIGYLNANPLNVRFTSNPTGLSSLPPVITSITNNGESFIVNFTQDGTVPVLSYCYSLNSGITFTQASAQSSQITITNGIRSKIIYRVVIKNISASGDSGISNMVPAIIS